MRLGLVLEGFGKKHVKVQTAWGTAKSVDWDKKTMVCTGVADDLDYEGVLLGVGYCCLKPKVGTLCLVGMIENNAAAAFLIDAQEIEEMDIKTSVKVNLNANELVINGGGNDGLVLLHKLEDNLNQVKQYMTTMNQAVGTALGTIDGTAGSASSAPYQSTMSSQQIVYENMENAKVKQ